MNNTALKKFIIKLFAVLLALYMAAAAFPLSALAYETNLTYSYVYDAWKTAVDIPDPYYADRQIYTDQLGTGSLKNPQGMYIYGDSLFICDTGNNRIVELDIAGSSPAFVREITGDGLSSPTDICVLDDGSIIIADGGNNRILFLDKQGAKTGETFRPDNTAVDQSVPFVPQKLAYTAGHIFVQAKSVNKGLMEFSSDGSFLGYSGASPVKFEWADYFWKLVATDEQRAAMNSFVPTEYNNVATDSEGFLLVTNSIFTAAELRNAIAEPVRRLNLKGTNILIQNGNHTVIGDLTWDSHTGPSRFTDITALNDGTYYTLDSIRGRIFGYDEQGNMLYAFGGLGTKQGYFSSPTAIEHHGKDLYVLDSSSCSVTVFHHTEFGALISKAITLYGAGRYDESKDAWEKVLKFAGNYEMAWDGIGKVLLRQGDYEQALKYLKYAEDEYYYSKAWKLYRKDWIENNIGIIVGVIGALLVFVIIKKIISKVKNRVYDYESRISKNQ